MLYELLTGHRPFDGSSVYEIVAAILDNREAPPLPRSSSNIPAELERIVTKALRKNREERYQTSKDLLLDLQSLRQRVEFESRHPASRLVMSGGGRRADHVSLRSSHSRSCRSNHSMPVTTI